MKNKGITLIALVITIIILIILAGVTLNLALGENGLFNKAKVVVEDYKREVAKGKIELAIQELTIEKQRNIELSELNEITDEYIEIQIDLDGNVEIYSEENKNYALAKVDGYYFKIYDDMTLEFLRKLTEEEMKEPEYVKEGLIVWYDGINNTRIGHDSTATIWENLVEDANNGTLKNVDFSSSSGWTNNSLILDGVNDWVQMSYLYYDNMTVEIVAKPLDVNITKYQIYISNFENGGIGIRKDDTNHNVGLAYSKTSSSFVGAASDKNIRIGQIYSMSAAYDGNTMYFSENGNLYTKEQSGLVTKPQNSTTFAIGTNPSGTSEGLPDNAARTNLEVYSVRIYNRALTEEEIKHNYEIDEQRFKIEQLPESEELGYVQDGLVCLYDGKQNTKYGHSKKTNTWQNLTGNVNMILRNINHTSSSGWTNNSIILDGVNDYGILNAYIHYSKMTIEVVAKPLAIKSSGSTYYTEYYFSNMHSGGVGIRKNPNNLLYGYAYVGTGYKSVTSNNEIIVGKTYSMSSGYNGSEVYLSENGDIYKINAKGTLGAPISSTRLAIGTNPAGSSEELSSNERRTNVEMYSIRVYNRCLTDEEIQANYLIDKERFNIE